MHWDAPCRRLVAPLMLKQVKQKRASIFLKTSWECIVRAILFSTRAILCRPWRAAFFLVFVAVMMAWFWKHPISGCGGLPFFGRVEIAVPVFFQEDSRWSNVPLGSDTSSETTPDTIGSAGCALSSAAMVLSFYGVNLDPKKLNKYLIAHNGYESTAWLKWEVAATYPPGIAEHMYEDLPSYGLIDWNLLKGNPVIVRIRRATGRTHFVVIVGKRGLDYLVRDPGLQGHKGVYPFYKLSPKMEALRYYRKK